jgi:type IV secretory pathway VirB4 component
MDTTSIATTFPFVSSELTMDHGVMYGMNLHNRSLVIFDRFDMENANSVIFAKSGAGKSYFVKLEAIRWLMLGAEVLIIDPEKEFEPLCKAVNGAYISFSH